MQSLNMKYISRIDHLRFFAATFVILHHFKGNLNFIHGDHFSNLIKLWMINGSSGVSFFLVLTGFLFCLISQAGEKEIKYFGFIYNRILRIFPLTILLVFIVICCSRQQSTPMDIFRILTLQFNTGNPMTGWGHEYFPSGPIWTIGVEFQFYLVFPFIILFFKNYHLKYLLALILLMIIVKTNIAIIKGGDIYYNLYHTIIGRLDQFVVGIIFGYLYQKGFFRFLSNWMYQILFIGFVFAAFTLLFLCNKTTIQYCALSFTIEAVLWGILAVCYLECRLPNILIIDKTFSYLGMISFSMYLLHLPIGIMIGNILNFSIPVDVTSSLLQSMIRLPVIIILSFFTFYIIEKPFMLFRKKYTR